MGWSELKVWRIEADKVRVLIRDVRRLLKLYQAEDAQAEALLELAQQAREPGWWHQYADGAIPQWFQAYVGLEAGAASLRMYDAELMPGLLQTAEYYRAFMRTDPAASDDQETERKAEVRITRQKRLTTPDAPHLWAVLNEAALRRVVGGRDVMRAQLTHLAEMTALDRVTMQVLPFAVGAHPAMDGSFKILGFPEPSDPEVVYLENQAGSLYLEKPEQVRRYTLMFDYLRAQALPSRPPSGSVTGNCSRTRRARTSWSSCATARTRTARCSASPGPSGTRSSPASGTASSTSPDPRPRG